MQGSEINLKVNSISLQFVSGGGEMGELTRNFDWTKTSIGSFDNWPGALKTAVGILLHTDFPMFLWWGPDMIQFYNDAYRPSLGEEGKHPGALGQKGKDCWPEIWETIYPLIEKVRRTGESFFIEDSLIPIFRNGKIEDVYWTFSYSAVIGEMGSIDGILVVCNETTKKVETLNQLKQSRLEIAESEERFRTMAEGSGILIAVGDESSNATYFNQAWVEMTGRPMDELLQFGWVDLVHPDDRKRYVNIYLTAFEKRVPFTGEFRVMNKEGDYRWLLAKGPPRFRTDGSFAGYIASCVDITDLKNAERVLQDNKLLLEELVQQRTLELERSNSDLLQFAHVASHDLKEPVRKIKTFANRLKDEGDTKLTAKENQFVDKILSASDRMASMIDGVLAFSTINSSEQKIELVDLNETLCSIQYDLELLINQKSANLKVSTMPNIEGSRVLIYQLFYNLINNSLKFSKSGVAPEIKLSSRFTSNSNEYLEIVIVDNGIGFDARFAEKIFENFSRLNSKEQFDGTGLGLSLCKKIVERHNGKISAKGDLGAGSEFTVMLPVKQKAISI